MPNVTSTHSDKVLIPTKNNYTISETLMKSVCITTRPETVVLSTPRSSKGLPPPSTPNHFNTMSPSTGGPISDKILLTTKPSVSLPQNLLMTPTTSIKPPEKLLVSPVSTCGGVPDRAQTILKNNINKVENDGGQQKKHDFDTDSFKKPADVCLKTSTIRHNKLSSQSMDLSESDYSSTSRGRNRGRGRGRGRARNNNDLVMKESSPIHGVMDSTLPGRGSGRGRGRGRGKGIVRVIRGRGRGPYSTGVVCKTVKSGVHKVGGDKTQNDGCAYPTFKCTIPKIEGFNYCKRHILIEPKGVYRQCTYVYYNGKKCLNAVLKANLKRDATATTLCFEHNRQTQLQRTHMLIGKVKETETNEVFLNKLKDHIDLSRKRKHPIDIKDEPDDEEIDVVSTSNDTNFGKSMVKTKNTSN